MTLRAAFEQGCNLLQQTGVETPVLDAMVLLAEALSVSKEQLYASFAVEIAEANYQTFQKYLALRVRGIPVSYIRGKKEFYELEFKVDERVLVPRPETELLVETVFKQLDGQSAARPEATLSVHDVCTGTGCIAITIRRLRPQIQVSASDISAQAGEVFLFNSTHILGYALPFTLTNLLEEVAGPFDIITANPPYLKQQAVDEMKSRGWPEPALALAGGEDGLFYIRQLINQSESRLKPGGVLIMEADPDQMPAIAGLLENHHYKDIRVIQDLGGYERVIYGTGKQLK
jgi:release factor glutamine methyltransferase